MNCPFSLLSTTTWASHTQGLWSDTGLGTPREGLPNLGTEKSPRTASQETRLWTWLWTWLRPAILTEPPNVLGSPFFIIQMGLTFCPYIKGLW